MAASGLAGCRHGCRTSRPAAARVPDSRFVGGRRARGAEPGSGAPRAQLRATTATGRRAPRQHCTLRGLRLFDVCVSYKDVVSPTLPRDRYDFTGEPSVVDTPLLQAGARRVAATGAMPYAMLGGTGAARLAATCRGFRRSTHCRPGQARVSTRHSASAVRAGRESSEPNLSQPDMTDLR